MYRKYYSILFVNINVATGEKLAIGLAKKEDNVIYKKNRMRFKYSKKRIKALKKILPKSSIDIIKEYCKLFAKNKENDIEASNGKNGTLTTDLLYFELYAILVSNMREQDEFNKIYRKIIKREQ